MAGRPGPRHSRRDEILELFTRRVAERGYDATNLGDLAAELGISKGTIVHHFVTKDRMLAEVHETYMQARFREAEHMIDALDSPAEQLDALMQAFILYQQVDRWATIAFQRETVRFRGDDVMAVSTQLRRDYFGLVRGVLERGIAAGLFRPCDTALTALAIFGSVQWAWTWFDVEGPSSTTDVAREFLNVFMHGVLAVGEPYERSSERIDTVVRGAIARVADEDAAEAAS